MATFSGGTLLLDAGSITDQHLSSAAAVTVDKQQHAYKARTNFGQAIGATPATREEIVFVATAAGLLRSFNAGLNVTGSTSSMTFDLKKNGTTVLTSVITVTNANSNRQVQTVVPSSVSFVAGDVFSISLTVTTSTGAQGPFAWVGLSETTAP